jgi:hypothetical protein
MMTAAEFRARLEARELTLAGFAALAGVNPTTASYWGRDRPGAGPQAFPAWVPLLLAAWERGGLQGPQLAKWDGNTWEEARAWAADAADAGATR